MFLAYSTPFPLLSNCFTVQPGLCPHFFKQWAILHGKVTVRVVELIFHFSIKISVIAAECKYFTCHFIWGRQLICYILKLWRLIICLQSSRHIIYSALIRIVKICLCTMILKVHIFLIFNLLIFIHNKLYYFFMKLFFFFFSEYFLF